MVVRTHVTVTYTNLRQTACTVKMNCFSVFCKMRYKYCSVLPSLCVLPNGCWCSKVIDLDAVSLAGTFGRHIFPIHKCFVFFILSPSRPLPFCISNSNWWSIVNGLLSSCNGCLVTM